MCKSVDRSMVVGDVTLWEKTGGRSGVYRRAPDPVDSDGLELPLKPLLDDDEV
jgi:cyclic pyranopterin phosphate synthase